MNRSYVDLCMFVQFMHWEPDLNNFDINLLENGTNEEVADYINSLDYEILDPARLVHETYHVWQGLRLPYLHWYAFHCWRACIQIYGTLMNNVGLANLTENCIDVPVFNILSKKYKCIYLEDLLFEIREIDKKTPKSAKYVTNLSVVDLLETAASIVEWQFHVSKKDDLNWKSFRRWTKNNAAYTEAYDFICQGLEDESLANRCALSLINVCFETTKPVMTFVYLTALLKGGIAKSNNIRDFIKQEEPCRWIELFRMILENNIKFEEFEKGNIETTKYSRISLKQVVGWTSSKNGIPHPFLGLLAQKWLEMGEAEPGYNSVFSAPGWFKELTGKCLKIFSPPLTLIRIQLPTRARIVIRANLDNLEGLDKLEAITNGKEFIHSVLVAYGIVRQTSHSFMDPENRLCHHVDCPEYGRNMCNAYMHIPLKYQDCKFSDFSKSWYLI